MLFLRALYPRYKAVIDLFTSKQKDISITSIDSIVLDAQFMDELSFFGSVGNPDPITDDLVDTMSPPELSPVESIDDDETLLLSMGMLQAWVAKKLANVTFYKFFQCPIYKFLR